MVLVACIAGSAFAAWLATRDVPYGGSIEAWGDLELYSDSEMTVPYEGLNFGSFTYSPTTGYCYHDDMFFWMTVGNEQSSHHQNVSWAIVNSVYDYGGAHTLVKNTWNYTLRVAGVPMICISYYVDGELQSTDSVVYTNRYTEHNSTVQADIFEGSLVGDFSFDLRLISEQAD